MSKVKANTIKNKFLIIPFLLCYFIRQFSNINSDYLNILICIIGLTVYLRLYFYDKEVRRNSKFIFLFVFTSIVSMCVTNNVHLGEIVLIVAYQGVAFAIVKDKTMLKYFHWCLNLIYIFFLISYVKDKGLDNILSTSSSNFVSVILIMFLIMSSIYLLSTNRKPSIFSILIGVIFCIIAGGRGGILSVLCLGTGIFYLNQISSKSILERFLFILVVSIGYLIGYFIYYDKITYYLGNVTYDAPRFYIWQLYISSTLGSIKNIIFGTPFETHIIFIDFLRNLHNIFFNVHAKYGLLSLIMIIYGNFRCLVYYIKTKNYYYSLFIIILLLRSFTDYTSFPGVFDIVWFYLLYDCMNDNLKSHKYRNNYIPTN